VAGFTPAGTSPAARLGGLSKQTLTAKGKGKRPKVGVFWNCQINKRFLYRPVLDFRITLEARNPARHCLRQYRVEAGADLFGVWVVEISYGRIGTAGRSRSYVVHHGTRFGSAIPCRSAS
jgi:hypothetical protein